MQGCGIVNQNARPRYKTISLLEEPGEPPQPNTGSGIHPRATGESERFSRLSRHH